MIGRIVYSNAGRDKGRALAVLHIAEHECLVCDGKEHPLSRPKRKNLKHICLTDYSLSSEQLLTDKSLRRALAAYRCAVESLKEETG